jgi:hypothetical protein
LVRGPVAVRVPADALGAVEVGALAVAGLLVVGGEVVTGAFDRAFRLRVGGATVVAGVVVLLDAPGVAEVVAPELLSPASETVAGSVWKLRTPARPSSVPATTNGERFMVGTGPSEGELLEVDPVGIHPQL